MTYTIKPDAVAHTCWDKADFDGLMQPDCAGCDEAEQHPCQFCGYGHGFTTHNDLAHIENGDPHVPEDPEEAWEPEDAWYNSPHVYKSA